MSDEKRDGNSESRKSRSTPKPGSRNEFDFINLIKKRALESHKPSAPIDSSLITHYSSLLQGIGDDAAVIRQSNSLDLVVTTDLLIENIDFRLEWISPRLLGHKALAVSLSDIAAMGAQPKFALLSLGVPRELWKTKFVDEFYEGFFELADEHQVTLIGGDISRAPKHVVIDSILIGEVKRGHAVLRSGAKPGDRIFVTGSLGGAAAGLKLLEEGVRVNHRTRRSGRADAGQKLLMRQLKPEPRVAWGAVLGEKRLATAMIDISDGLSSDLTHLCEESGVGARIYAVQIPINRSFAKLKGNDLHPLSLALNGGEDFELLFTVKPGNLKDLPNESEGVPITHIGNVTKGKAIKLIEVSTEKSLQSRGFKHF